MASYVEFVDLVGTYKRVVWRLKSSPKQYVVREDPFFYGDIEVHRVYVETKELHNKLSDKDVFCKPKK